MDRIVGANIQLLVQWYEQLCDVCPEWLEPKDYVLGKKLRKKLKAMNKQREAHGQPEV